MADRIARTRVNINTTTRPTVGFQGSSVPVQLNPVAEGGGIAGLAAALDGFFGGAQNALRIMRESEVREELAKIDRQNDRLKEQANADALAGRPRDAEANAFVAYRDTYSKALGAAMWQEDSVEFDKGFSGLTPDKDPMEDYAKPFINERIKGADPITEAAYRSKALAHAAAKAAEWTAKRQIDTINTGIERLGMAVAGDLKNNVTIDVDYFNGLVRDMENLLPVGQKAEARVKALSLLMKQVGGTENASILGFLDAKQDNGLTLRQMYPDLAEKAEQDAIRRATRVPTVEAHQDLKDIKIGMAQYAAGHGGLSPQDVYERLVRHEVNWGRSDALDALKIEFYKSLGSDAGYEAFKTAALQRLAGRPGSPFLSAEDWKKHGDRLMQEVFADALKMGKDEAGAWAEVTQLFVQGGAVAPAFKLQATRSLLSDNVQDRILGYQMVRGLAAASPSNPALFREAVGEKGAMIYEAMELQLKAGKPLDEAANATMALDFTDPKRFAEFPIADNKRETVAKVVDSIGDELVQTVAPADLIERVGGWLGLTDRPSIALTAGLRQKIEDTRRKAGAIHDKFGAGDDYLNTLTAKMLAGDVEVAYRDGTIFLSERRALAPGRPVDVNDIARAAEAFSDRLAPAFGGTGANLAGLIPALDGRGLEVVVATDAGEQRAVLYSGQEFVVPGRVERVTEWQELPNGGRTAVVKEVQQPATKLVVPDQIGPEGWVPDAFKGSGYAFVPTGQFKTVSVTNEDGSTRIETRPYVALRYIGETPMERTERMLREKVEVGQAKGPDVIEPTRTPAENLETTAGYWLERKVQAITDRLLDAGILDPKTFLKVPRPNIQTEADAREYLERVFKEARTSSRLTPRDSGAHEVYETQRFNLLSRLEGKRLYVYDDTDGRRIKKGANTGAVQIGSAKDPSAVKGNRTVGIGFNMDRPDARQVFKLLGIKDFDAIYDGEKGLEETEVMKLFNYSVEEFERLVDEKTKGVNLTRNQRLALVSMAFNGPRLLTDTLVTAIREGRMNDAAAEIARLADEDPIKGRAARRKVELQLFKGLLNN